MSEDNHVMELAKNGEYDNLMVENQQKASLQYEPFSMQQIIQEVEFPKISQQAAYAKINEQMKDHQTQILRLENQCADQQTLEEVTKVDYDGWQSQTKSQIIVSDSADDQEDQNFNSECFEGHILMLQVDIQQGDVSVTENLNKQMDTESIQAFQMMSFADFKHIHMQGAKTELQELTNIDFDGWRIHADCLTILCDVADNQNGHNFDFELVQDHILMPKIEYEEGEHSIAENLTKQIVLWSNLSENESDKILIDRSQQVDYQEQVFEEYEACLQSFEDQSLMQNDEFSSLSSMEVFSKIDVGQVVVNSNILLLEDVCFKADDVVQVNCYRMDCQMQRSDCQMWMTDCQNSDFHVLQILELQLGPGGMQIDYLWEDLGPNLLDKGCFGSIQLGGCQLQIFEGCEAGFTSPIMSKQVWRIKSDSRRKYEAEFSSV